MQNKFHTIYSRSVKTKKQKTRNKQKRKKSKQPRNFSLRKIKDLNKWRYISCSQIGRFNMTEILILHKLINRFSIISIKLPEDFFRGGGGSGWRTWFDKLILRFTQKYEGLRKIKQF